MNRVILLLLVLLSAMPARAGDTLHMLYFDREPYYVTRADGPGGILVDRVNAALAEAGSRAEWTKAAPARIVEIIRGDLDSICSPGWFRTPERAELGRFTTAPLYRDPPMGLLVRRNSPLLRASSIQDILADPGQRLLIKAAFSYGKIADGLIAGAKSQVMTTAARNSQLARMVAGGRADLMLITAEEARPLLDSEQELSGLVLFAPTGLDAGEQRFVWCSKSVPPATVAALSDALARLYPDRP